MHRYLKSTPRWLQAGWLLPLVLIALPNCILNSGPYDDVEESAAFDPGLAPQTGAVMCDIPKYKPFNADEDCATDEEVLSIKSKEHAAIGLAEGDGDSIVLDYSADSLMLCGGKPRKVEFHGPYPTGSTICLNCDTQITAEKYVDSNAVCVAKCIDLTNQLELQPNEGVQSFCQTNARVATNFTQTCYPGACFNATSPDASFDDPRRHPEKVAWETDPDGFAEAIDNTVGKPAMAPAPVNGEFDSAAASKQTITRGDAWIEFEAKEGGVSHVLGVSGADVSVQGLKLPMIASSLSLNYNDNNIYVLENGINGDPIGTYAPEQRFRLVITDNHDGTAAISYRALDQNNCEDGKFCPSTEIGTSPTPVSYPLRVFAMFRERPAQLTNVTMVYIKEQP